MSEIRTSVDQNRLVALKRLLNSAPGIFRRQAAIVATYRTVVSRRTGEQRKSFPCYCLRYRDGGRQQAFYLGRSGAFADAAEKVLAMLQTPRRQALKIARLRQTVNESLRRSKAEFDRQLREQFGARLKGWEIRGWTKSGVPRLCWQLAQVGSNLLADNHVARGNIPPNAPRTRAVRIASPD